MLIMFNVVPRNSIPGNNLNPRLRLWLQLTRGFNLEDLLKSDTPLSELLTFTTEINFEWHVKLAELVSRFFCNMEVMDRGQRSDSRGAMDNKAKKAAAIAAWCAFPELLSPRLKLVICLQQILPGAAITALLQVRGPSAVLQGNG